MTYDEDKNEFRFECSGRTAFSTSAIIGLEAGDSVVTHGHDGTLVSREDLSGPERRELAQYMIQAWTKWGAGA